MSNLAIKDISASMARLDEIATESALVTTTGNPFSQAVTMASAMQEIRSSLTDEIMQRAIMPLMNSKLGFRTDKDPARPAWNKRTSKMEIQVPYGIPIVRECLIEATLRGLPPVGNCWNIISQQSYITKEGFWFLLGKKVVGLTDFKVSIGVPKMIHAAGDARNSNDDEAKGALVNCFATWKLNGVEDRTERDIPIRVNAMMGADAIMGKAERKILAAAYAQITGTALGEGDATEDEPVMRDATPRATAAAPAEVAAALAPRRGRPPKQEAPAEIVEDAPGDSTTQEVTLVGIGVEKRTQRDGKTPYDLFVITYNNGFADCQASTISRAIVEPVNGLASGARISIAVEPRNIEGESDKLVSLVAIGGEA